MNSRAPPGQAKGLACVRGSGDREVKRRALAGVGLDPDGPVVPLDDLNRFVSSRVAMVTVPDLLPAPRAYAVHIRRVSSDRIVLVSSSLWDTVSLHAASNP